MKMNSKRLGRALTIALIFISMTTLSLVAAESFGQFKGDVVAKFLPDGRNMEVVTAFEFIDEQGQNWMVPAGATTDGASIPQAFWILYPPFTGKYRAAAVVHDYYCQIQSHSWKETHKAFYFALRASGVDATVAKTMYGAVYYFGPRWGLGAGTRGPGGQRNMSEEEQEQYVRELQKWINKENPDLDMIAQHLENGK